MRSNRTPKGGDRLYQTIDMAGFDPARWVVRYNPMGRPIPGGLSGRFTSRALRVQVVAWGRRRGLVRAFCRLATCFAGIPGQPVSQSVTSIATFLYVTSSNHQHHHTSRGESSLSERGRVSLSAPGLSALKLRTKANTQREEANQGSWISSRLILIDEFVF